MFLEYKLLLCEPNIEFKKLWEENPLQLTIVLRRIRADMRSKKTVTELVKIAYVFVFFPSNRIFVTFSNRALESDTYTLSTAFYTYLVCP